MTAREEMETTITQIKGERVQVYTANPVHLRALRKKVSEGRAIETRGDAETGFFVIDASEFDPLKGFKRKQAPMSDEERARRRERFIQNVL